MGVVVGPRLGILMPMVKDAKPLDNYVRPAFWQKLSAVEIGAVGKTACPSLFGWHASCAGCIIEAYVILTFRQGTFW